MNPKVKNALEKTRDYAKLARVELLIIVGALFLDLVTKAIVTHVLNFRESRRIIPNFLYFTYTRNTRAAFGSYFGLDRIFREGAAGNIAFIFTVIIGSAIAFGVLYYLFRNKKGKDFFIKSAIAQGIAAFSLILMYILLPRSPMLSFFITLTFVAVFGFSVALYYARGKTGSGFLVRVGLALIIGGALGNLVDRMFLGYVRDFIHIVYFGLTIFGQQSFAIFNIADAALTVGVVVFAIGYIRGEIKKKPEDEAAGDAEAVVEAVEDEDYRDRDTDPMSGQNE